MNRLRRVCGHLSLGMSGLIYDEVVCGIQHEVCGPAAEFGDGVSYIRTWSVPLDRKTELWNLF